MSVKRKTFIEKHPVEIRSSNVLEQEELPYFIVFFICCIGLYCGKFLSNLI
jgi:hypothetical protein